MSNTRRVQYGQPRTQNGWASAIEYKPLRPINGTAVVFKAELIDDPKQRELLFFLQGLTLREGGTKRLARELLEMFPDRIGTPTMHQLGCKPGKRFTVEQCEQIEEELDAGSRHARLLRLSGYESEPRLRPSPTLAAELLAECSDRCESQLPGFIEEFCCNPKLELSACDSSYRRRLDIIIDDTRHALESDKQLRKERSDLVALVQSEGRYEHAELHYFQDVLGALFEFKRRYEQAALNDYVETSIGRIVFEALDYALETGRSALIEGNSGFGKTIAQKAWVNGHLGRARFVQLTGITTQQSFFQKLSVALGVGNGRAMSTGRIQNRVEDFLRRSKLMLVIDESQYLWPQGKRIVSHPALVNWLNTACYNEGVPFALSATKQFTLRRQNVETQTDWSSEQSRRRTRRVFPLPDKPTGKDLEAVAGKLLAELGDNAKAINLVVGYALTSRGYFQSITDVCDDARLIAHRAGRERITFADLKAAVMEWRAPSDAALQRVFDTAPERPSRRRSAPAPGQAATESAPEMASVNEPLTGDYSEVKPRFKRPADSPRVVRGDLVGAG